MAKIIRFLKACTRVIGCLLVVAGAALILVHPDEFGRAIDLIFLAILVMLIASQFFWVRRVLDLGERFIPGEPRRGFLAVVATLVYLFFFIYSFGPLTSSFHILRVADTRLSSVLMEGAFWWWLVGSWAGFGLVIVFWTADRAMRSAAWLYRKARDAAARHFASLHPGVPVLDPPSPDRRRFLQQTFVAVSATPFLAAGYGLLYGRLDVEVTRLRIGLTRLPKAFEGFRIAQLSDIHISPFMPANEIRRCVAVTNRLNPDLIVMTGDFVAWDSESEG